MNAILPANPELRLERTRLLWTLAALAAMTLPHALHLAPWIVLTAALIASWRLGVVYFGWPLFSRYTSIAFGVLAFVGVYASYHTFNGAEAGSALLILLAALKLMEARGLRDYFLLLVITLIIGITNFFYEQTIPLAIYMVPAVWLAGTALLNIAHPGTGHAPLGSARTSARMLLSALPVALVLFLLFPRIPGPLWSLTLPQQSGVTGLSTSMSPGSLSHLAQSDAIAFRVKFLNAAPPRSQLYWRALVLHDYDGQTWTPGSILRDGSDAFSAHGAPVPYQVTLQPNGLRLLYALDLPAQVPANTRLTSDYEILTSRPVTELRFYDASSYTDYRYGLDLPARVLRRDLRLPPGIDPRAYQLAQSWRAAAAAPDRIVEDALHMFHQEPFRYTLQPGALSGPDRIDEFLFGTRSGFCEHYASAFVFLMRAAGIPAHVVIGYQGGTRNPVDGYYVVRQEDAHAWAEVWLAGRGWVRVDPTAAVDPARVDQGLEAALPGEAIPGYFFNAHPWVGQLRNVWDALNNGWNQWILAYGPELQSRFFSDIGLAYGNWLQLVLALLIAICAILLLIWLVLWWRHRAPRPSAVQRDYLRFCRKLANRGLARAGNEGPLDYAQRVSRVRPDLAASVRGISALYISLRYARNGDARAFARQVHAFRP